MSQNESVEIRISREARRSLKDIRVNGETYDDVIIRLINMYWGDR